MDDTRQDKLGNDILSDTPTDRWSCYTTPPAESLELFEVARSRCPVAHSNEHDGFYMLLDFKDVRRAMLDHQTFSSAAGVLRPVIEREAIPALEMDPPRHGVWRELFTRAVSAKSAKTMEEFVRADVGRHIDTFIERGSCDLVAELAEYVPAETICRLVGVDDHLIVAVRDTAIAMIGAQGDGAEYARRESDFAAVVIPEIHARRANPRDDYLTYLATLEVEGSPLRDGDYVGLLIAFLGAGHHSTTSAMSSLMYEVLSKPEVRSMVEREPSSIVAVIEETLRLHPPIYGFFRQTTQTTEVSGVTIPARTDVYMGWAAGNRDPKNFDNPCEFRPDRPNKAHLTFGYGVHTCPGAALARMELRVLIEELLRRIPDLRVSLADPVYSFGGADYAYLPTLPATFTPGRRDNPA